MGMNEGIVGHVATTRKPLLVENVLDESLFKDKEMAKRLGLVSMREIPEAILLSEEL